MISVTTVADKKIKQLLIFIANAVPFTPNWNKILDILQVGDLRTLKMYFSHLESACLVKSISKASVKLSKIESVDKVYLDNTNQLFAISSKMPEISISPILETIFKSLITNWVDCLTSNSAINYSTKFLFNGSRKFWF